MKCPGCQHENRTAAKFCEECAAPLARTCPNCGSQVSATAKFCPECAHSLAPPAGDPRFASPKSYTPQHLADRILTSRAALEGERKQVTVLFADIKGSMELLADRDPEEAQKLLDPVLERMIEAVHRYEGTVNDVMGDGIMALFGAPLAHEDHAVRACYAALRMQETVSRYAHEVQRSHGVSVTIRVGLNSGELVVCAIGNDLHMDYTVVGQTAHLAARMEQMAKPGSVLTTANTLQLVEGYVAVKPLGPVPVKGLADLVKVYEVTGAGAARTRLQAAAMRGFTRFLGRDTELEQLRRVQQLAGNGHGQVAAIVGEAGVGKSRLVYEFTHSHRLQGWLVLDSASVSYGKATSYLPVIDLLKGYFKIQDRDDLREIREKVTGKLLTLDQSLKPTLPALLALLEVPVDDGSWQTLDPGQRRHRTLDAVKRLLVREARKQPLLLVVEDLHWIDSETQALLDSLVDSLSSAPLLLLVNYRPEYRHGWGGKTSYSQLRLDALPAERAGELLDALLGDDPGLAPLKQLLVRRGNPFFLEETVRTLVETKALAGERGRYRLTQLVQAIQVSPTVQTMLAARIDRLPPEDKRLLQVASVVGKDVPLALIQAIADLPNEALRRGLDRLQSAEFLCETGLYPDLKYSFKHALTHEVTYGGLLQERRRELHAQIVDAIEALQQDRLGGEIERLAHHALRGELREKAVHYLRQAGLKAAARSAHRDAVGFFERALAVLNRLPESQRIVEEGIDIRFDLRNSFMPLGANRSAMDLLREAESLSEAIADRRRLSRALCFMTEHWFTFGEPDRAVQVGERALDLAGACDGELAIKVTANRNLARAHYALGDYGQALDRVRWLVETLSGDLLYERFDSPPIASVQSRTTLAWCLADLGTFSEAFATGKEAIRIAEAADHPLSITIACTGLGFALRERGDIPAAVATLERGLSLLNKWGLATTFPVMASTLGAAYVAAGRVAEAIPLLEQAAETAELHGRLENQSVRVAWLADAYRHAGRSREAIRLVLQALALARQHQERGREARVLQLLGDIQTEDKRASARECENHYHQGLALAEALGMRPVAAHCHSGLSRLMQRMGRRAEREVHCAAATALYCDMGMPFWSARLQESTAAG
jgi:class 3 adenylate cyclase/tetratricopeptide (TPR) repeat protein